VTNNVSATPLRYFYPETVEDIQAIVSEAEHERLRVRAVGSGHSFSEAAKGRDFLMDMKNLRDAERYITNVKSSLSTKDFVLADAGITIRRINRVLDSMGLALENMGAVDFQTISGALMTGTHGTGIKKPAFPDMVRSLRIVSTNSELIQIEPADGITDPVRHNANESIRLIQDDDIFYSTVLSFGGMGIVYQIVFEVVPAFMIHEHRYLENWSSLKQKMLSGEFMDQVHDNDFVAFRVNPYKVKGEHLCSIAVQNIVNTPSPGHKGMRNPFARILANREAIIEGVVRRTNRNPRRVANNIQTALKNSKVKSYTDISYKVFYNSGSAVLRYGISSEFAFDAKADKIIEVLEFVFRQTEYFEDYADLAHPSHIPVRFVKPSHAYLSSCYNRPTVYIDIPTLYSTTGYMSLLERYQNAMIKMGGIPHWGKINNMLYQNKQFIRDQFPMADKWIQVQQQMDPRGTFLNDFIISMGLI
jgi:FAD/FMN-containing dehydrogenase